MQVSVTSDVKALTKRLTAKQKQQIPFAVSKALNALAFDIRNTVQLALPRHLHAPTKYLSRGTQVEKADKRNLVAKIGFRSKTFGKGSGETTQASIMKRMIAGGTLMPRSKALPVPVPQNRFIHLDILPRTALWSY